MKVATTCHPGSPGMPDGSGVLTGVKMGFRVKAKK